MLRETRYLRVTNPLRSFLSIFLILGGTLFLALKDAPTLEQGPSLCLIKNISGHNCPGCGTTRAIAAVLRGEFTQAFAFNRLIILTFPLLALVLLWELASSFYTIWNLVIRKKILASQEQDGII